MKSDGRFPLNDKPASTQHDPFEIITHAYTDKQLCKK